MDPFTKVPNTLLSELARLRISGGQFSIVLAVVRHTYGFHRESAEISIGFLMQATGRHRINVAKDLKVLLQMGILTEFEAPTYVKGRHLGVNEGRIRVPAKSRTVGETTDTTVGETTDTTVGETTDQEIKKRKTKDDSRPNEDAGAVYDYYAQHVRAGARADAIKNITRLLNQYSKKELISWIDRYAKTGMAQDKHYRIQANNFFGKAARYQDYMDGAAGPCPSTRLMTSDEPGYL